MIVGERVSVGTSATLLNASMAGARRIVVKNLDGSAAVDLGNGSVTTGAGYQLAAGEALDLELSQSTGLYGVAAAGTVSVAVLAVR